MNDAGTVNSAVTDSVAQSNELAIGLAPASAMSMTYETMASSIGIVMHNAANNQQNMQVTTNAAVAVACAAILAFGSKSAG